MEIMVRMNAINSNKILITYIKLMHSRPECLMRFLIFSYVKQVGTPGYVPMSQYAPKIQV